MSLPAGLSSSSLSIIIIHFSYHFSYSALILHYSSSAFPGLSRPKSAVIMKNLASALTSEHHCLKWCSSARVVTMFFIITQKSSSAIPFIKLPWLKGSLRFFRKNNKNQLNSSSPPAWSENFPRISKLQRKLCYPSSLPRLF